MGRIPEKRKKTREKSQNENKRHAEGFDEGLEFHFKFKLNRIISTSPELPYYVMSGVYL